MEHSASPDLLQDLADEIVYEQASKGMRLVNFIIDMIVVGIINSVIGGMIQVAIFAAYISDMGSGPDFDLSFPVMLVVSIYVVQLSLFIAYFSVCEKLMKGRTIGKMVTGTMAVREDGMALSWKNAILRSICRLIPFEPIVAIFTNSPWHDDLTGTMVIRKPM